MSTHLHAAAAEASIPTAPGLELSGFVARENPSCGQHDIIYARALALQANGHLMLLLTADVLGFTAQTVNAIRAGIAQRLESSGLKPSALSVTVTATHTHSAPASMLLRNCGQVDGDWLRQVVSTLTEVALQAVLQLQPAHLGISRGMVEGVAENRRTPQWLATNGLLPTDESVAGTTDLMARANDSELGLIVVETTGGLPCACIVNFSCHPVVLGADNRAISADFPGVVAQRLREKFGVITLFTNGAAADINPIRLGSWEDVEYIGSALAAEAERLWIETATTDSIALAANSQMLRLPLLPLPSRSELQNALTRFQQEYKTCYEAGQDAPMRVADTYRRWAQNALELRPEDLHSDLELQVLRLNDAALVAVPGEFFVELGLRIKQRLAQEGIAPTFILGYTNGNIGYIPTRSAYALGGYEIETAHRFYDRPSCVAPEAGEMIVQRAVEAVKGAE